MGDPPSPVRDRGELEAATVRCQNVAYYEGADLVRQAVVLAVAISQRQAFLDGNKRAAFAAFDVFLRTNGLVFRGPFLEIGKRLEAVAEARPGPGRDVAVARLETLVLTHIEATDPLP